MPPFAVAGVVQDTAFRPIPGATVEVTQAAGASPSTTSDAAGQYAFPAVFTAAIAVRASREGYRAHVHHLAPSPSHGGGYSVWFTLPPTAPSVDLAGEYTLTFAADPVCIQLPEPARRRSYAASIRPRTYPGQPPLVNQYEVVLSGASLLPNRDRMYAASAETFARFDIDADFDGDTVTERLSPSTVVSIWGTGGADVTGPSTTVPWSGVFEYCPETEELGRGCRPGPTQCRSPNHQLTLRRR